MGWGRKVWMKGSEEKGSRVGMRIQDRPLDGGWTSG